MTSPQRTRELEPHDGLFVARGGRIVRAAAALLALLLGATAAAAAPARVTVVEDRPERLVLRYALGDVELRSVSVDGLTYQAVIADGASPDKEQAGAPELPRMSRSVIVPDTGALAIRVLSVRSHDVPDVDVVPSKGILKRTVDPRTVPWAFGAAYGSTAPYPVEIAELRPPHVLRDHRGVVVDVHLVQALPALHLLRVYDELTVAIEPRSAKGGNELWPDHDRPSAAFEPIYRHHFLNYERHSRYPALGEMGSLLIIANDEWLPNVQPLVDHKNDLGIPTTAVGVSTIGNDAAAIQSYVQSTFDAGGLAFVLLVGDAAEVATPTVSGGASDPSYAKLAGDDDYPDVLVGRFSAESAADVDTQVARTIAYELTPATTQPWFKRAVGIGSSEGPGDDGEIDWQHIDKLRDALLAYDYDAVDQLYDSTGTATVAAVAAALNEGRGMVNYCGHGSMESWVTSGFSSADVLSLANQDMLPFLLSVACNNGEFDHGTCFGETWLRATREGQAVGAIGAYMSSISQSWDPPMAAQDEAAVLLAAESQFSLGALCFASSGKMMDEYGADGVEMFDTWILFGDPSVRIFGVAAPPSGLTVQPFADLHAAGPQGGPFDPVEISYVLRNYSSFAIDFAVEHDAPWVSIEPATGSLAPDATTTVTVTLNEHAAALDSGHFADELRFVNLADHDGDSTRSVTANVGEPTLQLSWPLDEDPGWELGVGWAFGTPLGQGGANGPPDPASAHTGDNVYGFNLAGDYLDNMIASTLTTTAIDCSHLSQVRLTFWRWLGVESSMFDQATVRASSDGESWTTVWRNDDETADTSWTQLDLDLSSVADGQSTVYLQWVMGPTDSMWHSCGWNIDDLELWGVPGTGCWDLDSDGYEDLGCGGDDCSDLDATVHPGAEEACGDGVDGDCDGVADADEPSCGAAGGAGGEGGGAAGGAAPAAPAGEEDDGCGCRLGGGHNDHGLAMLLGLAAAGGAVARRRRGATASR